MTTDIRLAFDHPEARAAATADEQTLNRISLRDHIVEVEIGAFQAERGHTQRICFNIVVEVVPLTNPIEDDVDRILSYDRVTEAIAIELAAERLNLLETLAERIADRVLLEPQARRIFVRIEKLDRGPGVLGVEIVRARTQVSLRPVDDAAPQPTLVYLSNAAIASDHLSAMIDALQADGAPLILCVGLPDAPAPQSPVKPAQRRIDLLAIEQNAWILAGRDKRCVVVETRTELDWAMKNGQISVWAPSKIVLDAVEGPVTGPRDALGLALWVAGQVRAGELVTIGVSPPANADIPTRTITLVAWPLPTYAY